MDSGGRSVVAFRKPPPPLPLLVIGRARTCQYPMNDGEGRKWLFCDDPRVLRGSSYCATHHAVCYCRPADVDVEGLVAFAPAFK